jgi:hypothetical protein
MDRYPSAAYLLGAMVDDGVLPDLALRIAHGYAEARTSLDEEQTHKWLIAMLHKLGPGHDYTALTVLAYPSDHIAPRYERLARENGWKEDGHAHDAEQE